MKQLIKSYTSDTSKPVCHVLDTDNDKCCVEIGFHIFSSIAPPEVRLCLVLGNSSKLWKLSEEETLLQEITHPQMGILFYISTHKTHIKM